MEGLSHAVTYNTLKKKFDFLDIFRFDFVQLDQGKGVCFYVIEPVDNLGRISNRVKYSGQVGNGGVLALVESDLEIDMDHFIDVLALVSRAVHVILLLLEGDAHGFPFFLDSTSKYS